MYKSPTWAVALVFAHMRATASSRGQRMSGYVCREAEDVFQTSRSAHSLVGGYVIEGHVPADVVKRLLAERPKITGLAVPGMPASAPGMDIPGQPYTIVGFDRTGQPTVYERR